jgi:hypothetical protein
VVAVTLPEASRRLFGDSGDARSPAGPPEHPDADRAAARVAPTLDAPVPHVLVLDTAAPDPHVMARLLEDGDREDLAWLCRQLPAGALAVWVERHGARRLSRRSLSFWAVTLDRPDLLPERQPALERRRELWPL